MQTLYQDLVKHFGGQVPASIALKISQANVSGYVSGRWNMSETVALRAEAVTKGKFKAADLCPSLKEFKNLTA